MNSPSTPEGPGSVSRAPNLPSGFADTFTSRYIDTGGLVQHVVTGGEGPPLLLVHGWPQTWYAWRLVMSALARDFAVIAPDQRGTGLSGKPQDGYDTGTLAADHPGRVARLAVAETPLPGVSPSPPLFANAHLNNALWHFGFNRLATVNDQLVTGREQVYFGWQFAAKAARPLPEYAVRHYVDTLVASPDALHASFAIYRALDAAIAQNQQRMTRRLPMPVLGIGGGHSLRDQVADTMKLAADDVQTLVIPDCGHHPAEEAPEEMLAALTAFLAPYRGEQTATHNPGPQTIPV
jgi:pimeloyl-ACP methyl ester carboxylesterase